MSLVLLERMTLLLCIFILIVWPKVSRANDANETAVQSLLDGVSQIAAPGVPGTVCVFGPDAFAVVQDKRRNGAGSAVVAAATFGRGRVLLFGHTGYLDPDTLQEADTWRLMQNALRWASGGKDSPRIQTDREALAHFLRKAGYAVDDQNADVWILSAHEIVQEAVPRIRAFVEDGGGLITAATGWGWVQLNPGKDLRTDLAANQLLAPMGVVFADGTARKTARDGFEVTQPPSSLLNASLALETFLNAEDAGETLDDATVAQISLTLSQAIQSLPPTDTLFLPHLRQVIAEHEVNPVPTAERPITERDILARLVLTQQVQEALSLPPEQIQPHPSAAAFPGASPEGTPRVTRTLTCDTRVPGWHSTGLYADPGTLITVEIPESAVDKGLKLRIGSTTCRNWHHSKWLRAPEITREYPLNRSVTRAANAFGGLIYLVVPKGSDLGELTVTIRGGVEAPYYVLGQTSLEDWRTTIRHRPAPWAELGSQKAILTVPSEVIRDLDDPETLMKLWDRILDTCAELAAWPSFDRERPQRYVADVQLCAGWMHAGNPIMVPTVTAPKLVDADYLRHHGDWGFFHETGHNHQVRDWTFDGTGEVTVNLFTMYVFDKVCGIPPEKGRMAEEGIRKRYLEYFANGPDFEEWKRRPFLALMMYYQLQQAFGWDAFKKVFAEYRGLSEEERPKTDDERRDQWLVRFSRTVGRNLGPFFEAWGVPTSEQARASIQDLPVWLPEDFPPQTPTQVGKAKP